MNRCSWVNNNLKYIAYHDNEWGKASFDDQYLFEMLVLESFQAGLSWECILNKRESFRKAFDSFNYEKVAKYDDKKIKELLNNNNIIRNKLKIKASINNTKIFIDIQKEMGSFSNYIWAFTKGKTIKRKSKENIVSNELSKKISKDLKSRGMTFVGDVIIYSYLQAIGIINDHEVECYLY